MKLLGSRLDALDVQDHLSEGALVEGAYVVMKVIHEDGTAGISTAWSAGMDFITRRGLLEYALDSERRDFVTEVVGNDDD